MQDVGECFAVPASALALLSRPAPGARLDAPHAGGNTGFSDDRDQSDVAGWLNMGAPHNSTDTENRVATLAPWRAPQLRSPYFSPNRPRAHPPAIAASCAIKRYKRRILQTRHRLQIFDALELFLADGLWDAENVKAQAIGRD